MPGFSDSLGMPATKPTSRELFAALQLKFPKAAVLREVSMDDEAEMARHAQYHARRRPVPTTSRYHVPIDESVEVPEDYAPRESVWVRRIDALIFEGKTRTAVEIKISRADFFRDTAAKREAWQRHTHRFIYLTPQGLVQPEEVPAGCGLWEYDPATAMIASVKRASSNKAVQDLPASMSKYFAWRAFAAEQKVARLRASGLKVPKGRRTRRHRAG